jgi:hypothetical protein
MSPSIGAVGAVAAASVLCHSAFDAVPASAVLRALKSFGAIRADGFDFRMWLHSLLLGAAAAGTFVYEMLTSDVIEPERSFRCMPVRAARTRRTIPPSALTSPSRPSLYIYTLSLLQPASTLGWALPAAELGYALHDMRDALRLGNAAFILHGVFVGGFLWLLFALDVAHHVTPMLSVHLSSVFLNLRRVDFGPFGNHAIDIGFVVSFFVLRLAFLPAAWLLFLREANGSDTASWGACMLGGRVLYLAVFGGAVLHGLNAFWAWQIVIKLRSRWRGADGIGTDAAEGHYHRTRTR